LGCCLEIVADSTPLLQQHRQEEQAASHQQLPLAPPRQRRMDDYAATATSELQGAPILNPVAHSSGCIPCTNSCVVVRQDSRVAVEHFGRFEAVLGPGLNFTGLDICGLCIGLRVASTRVMQNSVQVSTITRDKNFVTLKLAVQQCLDPEQLDVALYTLADLDRQIDSMVSNFVRAHVPQLTLDELFATAPEVSGAVRENLAEELRDFGVLVLNVLILDIMLAQDVLESLGQVYQQQMLREATIAQAEGEKVRSVKQAEARANAAHLQGQGAARCASAIIEGLREALTPEQGLAAVPSKVVMELYLMSESFEMLKQVAARQNTEVVFLNGGLAPPSLPKAGDYLPAFAPPRQDLEAGGSSAGGSDTRAGDSERGRAPFRPLPAAGTHADATAYTPESVQRKAL